MRYLIIAAALITPGLAVAQMASPLDPKPGCVSEPRKAKSDRPLKAGPLADMPPATQYMAVWRTENGCPKPMIVRRDIGSVGRIPGR